ncbi:fc789627-3e53-445c-83d8-1a9ac8f5e52b [Sclerotinia trifoliorum]|uniref:Fc789627-3e53-445c-83d8-1a9ac8f5e52b n=1 Tax=Sclerotinia trifoliorum TaxID=28548 RepID=A0A8H2VYN5_9HELO|nr:fc789627-3e53-445c-83d8-1a9ac8f5e52b [Sclerotinia trifoliorum]
MPPKLNRPIASTQHHNSLRNDIIEDGRIEKFRKMSLYTMMFLSAASPILYESHLLAWFIDCLGTLCLMAIVVRKYPDEIKKFGPVVFPTAGLPLVIIFASRASLLETMPWMPFAISMWLLITVYSCPAMMSLAQEVLQGHRPDLSKHGCYLHTVARDNEKDQDQAQDFDFNQTELLKSMPQSALNHELAFMGRPASIISTNTGDIDLDEGNTIGKFVAARFLSHFSGEDARFTDFPDRMRFHSQDISAHFPEAPEDSLIGHYSTTGSTSDDHV